MMGSGLLMMLISVVPMLVYIVLINGIDTANTQEDACTDCAAGKYNTEAGADNEAYCTVCGSGKYNPNEGSDDPDDCSL
ncbi:MAG: hypothetical protein ACK55Z_07155, partial [bacterium]